MNVNGTKKWLQMGVHGTEKLFSMGFEIPGLCIKGTVQ